MAAYKEQILERSTMRHKWKGRHWAKTSTARLLRRMAKRDPQEAPRRVRDVTRGWTL